MNNFGGHGLLIYARLSNFNKNSLQFATSVNINCGVNPECLIINDIDVSLIFFISLIIFDNKSFTF